MIQVLFFGQARYYTGQSELRISLKEIPDSESLWAYLLVHFPQLSAIQATTRIAKNLEFTQGNTAFAEDDEIALIPPVSGG